MVSCTKDKSLPDGALKDKTKRTILTYVFRDTNLFADLTKNINEMEQGWDPQTNGTLLVYLDASTRMTQFDGKPVLIEIQHDNSNLIVSKIVKVGLIVKTEDKSLVSSFEIGIYEDHTVLY